MHGNEQAEKRTTGDTFDSQSLIDLIFTSITGGFSRNSIVLSVRRKSPAEKYQEGVAKGRALGTKLAAELLQEISKSGPMVNPVHRFTGDPATLNPRFEKLEKSENSKF